MSTVKMFIEEGGPVAGEGGCHVAMVSDDAMMSMCFKEGSFVGTDVQKSKNEQLFFIGTENLSRTIDQSAYQGNSYLDVKGTLKKNSSGELISIGLNGKISGGSPNHFVYTGSVKATLTKEWRINNQGGRGGTSFYKGFTICYGPCVFQDPPSYGLKIIFIDFV